MFRRILPSILLLLMVMLDCSVLPMLTSSPYVPLLTLLAVIDFGLLLGRTRGALYGMIGGLAIDVLVATPLGLMTVLYLACGYFAGLAGRKFQRYAVTPVVTPLVLLLAFEAALALYLYMAGQFYTLTILRDALIRVGIETVLSQILYLLYDKMLKPSWSRYAAR